MILYFTLLYFSLLYAHSICDSVMVEIIAPYASDSCTASVYGRQKELLCPVAIRNTVCTSTLTRGSVKHKDVGAGDQDSLGTAGCDGTAACHGRWLSAPRRRHLHSAAAPVQRSLLYLASQAWRAGPDRTGCSSAT